MNAELTRNLTAVLRPTRFSEVIGYTSVMNQLRNQFGSGRIPVVMMFHGPSRGGKTTLAKIVAVSVNCTHAPFGEPCDYCVNHSEELDIHEINAAADNSAETMRNLIPLLSIMPQYPYRVIIFDEAQRLSPAAQSILFTPTEKPNQQNIFIFCTTDPSKLDIALRKRAKANSYEVTGLLPDEIHELVGIVATHVEPIPQDDLVTLGNLLGVREITAPGDVVSAVENLAKGMSVEEAATTPTTSGKVDYGQLCGAVIHGDWARCSDILRPAEPKDGADIRTIIGGFFRKRLLDPECPAKRAALLSQFIQELADHNTPEVGMQLSAAVASIWKICNWVQEAKQR